MKHNDEIAILFHIPVAYGPEVTDDVKHLVCASPAMEPRIGTVIDYAGADYQVVRVVRHYNVGHMSGTEWPDNSYDTVTHAWVQPVQETPA